ncbi:MAG: FAD:protein FMN transferase [Pseudomonadales bacterium]|nr:FAD:protein FMN transferase [Pseudomonadales bacterium]
MRSLGAGAAIIVLILLGVQLFQRVHQGEEDFYGIAYSSMAWHVRLVGLPPGYSHAQVQRALQRQLDAVDKSLSSWRADSEVNEFNRSAPIGSWVACSPWFCEAVAKALEVSQLSQGAYDITVAPLVNLWGFGPQGRQDVLPTQAQILAAQKQVGWRHLHQRPGALMRDFPVHIDLSSVGEGVGVDVMGTWLEKAGCQRYMISVAGTLKTKGRRTDGGIWHVAIERPDASGAALHELSLTNQAVSTSGSYRNYFVKDGVSYSHTIDPFTGRPVTHHGILVTVTIPPEASGQIDATRADALATAFNVLGPDRGLALAQRLKLAVFYVETTPNGWHELTTPQFEPWLHP